MAKSVFSCDEGYKRYLGQLMAARTSRFDLPRHHGSAFLARRRMAMRAVMT